MEKKNKKILAIFAILFFGVLLPLGFFAMWWDASSYHLCEWCSKYGSHATAESALAYFKIAFGSVFCFS